jgi:hypothetical protein
MNSTRFMFSVASLLALSLIIASGCNVSRPKLGSSLCGSKTFKVDPTQPHGVTPPDVYICEDDFVTWEPNGHTFKVHFDNNESPFKDNSTDFDNTKNKPTNGGKKLPDDVTVFKFKIEVVDVNKTFDPHVVVGGRN